MERRKAITTAATASLTLLAGAAGIALNSGIVGSGDDDVGQISLVGATSTSTASFGDLVDWTGVAPPVVKPSDDEPVATSTASGYEDADHGDHDDHDDRGEASDHDDHDDDDRNHDKFEGADDDD